MRATLVYGLGAPTARPRAPGDVLANGQCFLVRRAVLDPHGGYAPAPASWADDGALACPARGAPCSPTGTASSSGAPCSTSTGATRRRGRAGPTTWRSPAT